jgi:glucose dehydrogenase
MFFIPARSWLSIPTPEKLVWHFQPSPHDVHDWDAVETPVLLDGVIDGQPRKLAAPTGGPITYLPDGRQYILVAAGDSLYTFRFNDPVR